MNSIMAVRTIRMIRVVRIQIEHPSRIHKYMCLFQNDPTPMLNISAGGIRTIDATFARVPIVSIAKLHYFSFNIKV